MATSQIGGAVFTAPFAPKTSVPIRAVNTNASPNNNVGSTLSQITSRYPAGGGAPAGSSSAAAPGGGGGGGGGGGSGAYAGSTPFVDPYAKWGGYAGYQQAVGDYNSQRSATMGSINDRISNEATGYHSGLLDFIDSLRSGQRRLDAQSVQNELSRRSGTAGVYDTVGHGIRSGGVILANKNAGTSSATEGIARAYGDIGRRELNGVNNQYEQGVNTLHNAEADFTDQTQQGVRHLNENKVQISNGIVSDAQNAISALNQQAANASLPDRINIESEKERIRNDALTRLASFDAELNSGVSSAAPMSTDASRSKAEQLFTAGSVPNNPFDFTSSIPAQFQNTGPFASDLPLFSRPKKQTA